MAAPSADLGQLDASPVWALDDENVAGNITGAFNLQDINRKVFGDQDKVFDFDDIMDEDPEDDAEGDAKDNGKLLRNEKKRARIEKMIAGIDNNLNNRANKFKNLMTDVCNPAPSQAQGISFDKLNYDFKKLALGADNPVEALLSDPLQQNSGIDKILEEARKVDLFTSISNKQNLDAMISLAQDMDIMQEESKLFHTPEPFIPDQGAFTHQNQNAAADQEQSELEAHHYQDMEPNLDLSHVNPQPIEDQSEPNAIDNKNQKMLTA